MQFFHALQLSIQFREERLRQRHGPYFFALSPDRKHTRIEVEILYPKHAALRNAQPAPVLELGHKLEGMTEMYKDQIYFFPAKDRGDIIRRLRAGDVPMSSEIFAQHIPVEKQQGIERQILVA